MLGCDGRHKPSSKFDFCTSTPSLSFQQEFPREVQRTIWVYQRRDCATPLAHIVDRSKQPDLDVLNLADFFAQ